MYKYIDLHCDTITMLNYPKHNLENNSKMVDIPSMKSGGTLVQCFSDYVPTGFIPKPVRKSLSWKQFTKIADKKDKLLADHSEVLRPILTVNDIHKCENDGKIGALFTIEDLGVIGEDLSKLDIAYGRGVRISNLTWNHENTLAYPNSKNHEIMEKGLKEFGIEAVRKMNSLGIVCDVSHLSDGGFWDIVKYSDKPFIATHSNSRTMTNHPRNLTDDMIRALAQKGGVMGLNFAPQFLSDEYKKQSRILDMIKHIIYIRDIGGSDVLSIGTDFDGISGKLDIGTPRQMPLLFDALSRAGLSDDELEKMAKGNILRVFNEVLK